MTIALRVDGVLAGYTPPLRHQRTDRHAITSHNKHLLSASTELLQKGVGVEAPGRRDPSGLSFSRRGTSTKALFPLYARTPSSRRSLGPARLRFPLPPAPCGTAKLPDEEIHAPPLDRSPPAEGA